MQDDHREQRARSFGAVAGLYDDARPSYPVALVGELMGLHPRDVLDVGTGTGKAARLFVERGCSVTGIEPDERMAAVARGHGVAVEIATFEEWDPRGRRFDLLISDRRGTGSTARPARERPLGSCARMAIWQRSGTWERTMLMCWQPRSPCIPNLCQSWQQQRPPWGAATPPTVEACSA